MTYKQQFIKFMVDNGVLKFGEFTLKSGRKAPYFINTGNYKSGAQLGKLGEYYAQCIVDNGIKADTLVGPAYKGIPLAVTTAVSLYGKHGIDMDYCFDRKEVKDHGEGGLFVGKQLKDGERVIIIEDVMTSGKALRSPRFFARSCRPRAEEVRAKYPCSILPRAPFARLWNFCRAAPPRTRQDT